LATHSSPSKRCHGHDPESEKKGRGIGNLKTTKEQKVIVEKEVIIIESASPQVVYVPTYNPSVVYGTWAYPSYPPYLSILRLCGRRRYSVLPRCCRQLAWAMHGAIQTGTWRVDIDYNRNTNINNNINVRNTSSRSGARTARSGWSGARTARSGGQGQGHAARLAKANKWQHDASHRGGVSYRDQGPAQKFNREPGRRCEVP